ncbi:hypothetical protein BJF85_07605 [Saccharomonospora sp. CUA-673]|uniref:glycosyltransferase family 39 protein n=1 Tax=Saccharomonospora sp. CUA-673 TaxID=1904969 RepID=UPI0009608958|nr:glycosyltransferase family 39 protein [Saccharomonospora sp. CUA-673]OLT39069.1 hypothetical protein BJF85_07605 [Saccharomonospora sp. CUA-673]
MTTTHDADTPRTAQDGEQGTAAASSDNVTDTGTSADPTVSDPPAGTSDKADAGASPDRPGGFLARVRHGRDPIAWILGVLAAAVASVFVIVDLAWNQGSFIAPLDDVYIHLQYGKQLGSGELFRFNPGDPISTGASSMLYTFVLAFGHLLGFTGNGLLGYAVVLGIVCAAFATGLAYHLGRVLVGRATGVWTGVLTAVSGPLMWGAASGMEVGLTALLATGAVYLFVREHLAGRFRWTPVVGVALAFVRPEGMVLAIALSGAMLWTTLRRRREHKADGADGGGAPASRRAALWTLLPLLAPICQYAFYRIATGTFSANGVQSKSLMSDRPQFYIGDFVNRAMDNLRGAVGFFNGMSGQNYAFPGMLVIFVLGLAYVLVKHRTWRPLVIAMVVGFAGIVASVSTLSTALIHELRYFQPFLPIYILFTVIGLYALSRLVARGRFRTAALHLLPAIALLYSLVALPQWAWRFGWEAATIRDTNVSVAQWLRGNLPPNSVVGVKDVGAVAYYSGHRVVDTIGLTSNGFAEASNHGPGALYEQLRSLPPEDRPDYFAVYEQWPGAPMGAFVDTGVFVTEPTMTFELNVPRDSSGWSIVPFDELNVYEADWTLAGTGDRSPVDGDVRAHLDVGSLQSELDHEYEANMEQPGVQPYTDLRRQDGIIDSSRYILGGETFRVATSSPARTRR